MTTNIEVTKIDQIAIISFNRPDIFNAFNQELTLDFLHELISISQDNSILGLIITGKGKAFSAGGDLRAVSNYYAGASTAFHFLAGTVNDIILEIRNMSKPVVAAINGVAAGGGFSLALACDFRVLAKSAVLRQAYTSSGLSIDGGGTYFLPRLVGIAKSLELAAFDDLINADEALRLGLVTKIVDDDKTVDEAISLIKVLSKKSLYSFSMSKKLFNESFHNTLERQIELERTCLVECANHPDGQEGIKAFLEKRKPIFNTKYKFS